MKTERTTSRTEFIAIALCLVLIGVVVFNILQGTSLKYTIKAQVADAKEKARPANIELTTINANCVECSTLQSTIDSLKSLNGINITSEKNLESNSPEADSLIKTYNIKSLPTLIVRGEIPKAAIITSKFSGQTRSSGDALVFDSPTPPFFNISSGKVRGKVEAIIINKKDCTQCQNLSNIVLQLKKGGIYIEKINEYDDTNGEALIKKYGITKLPALIFDNELEAYPSITNSWPQAGDIAKDGSFIFRQVPPPYYDMDSQKTRGAVQVTYIKDKTCTTCYDVEKFHNAMLKQVGMYVEKNTSIDINDDAGKKIIEKYNITKAPTILLTGDVDAYTGLTSAWQQVGTIEKDGTYVFRSVEISKQPYKDTATDKVIPA